MKSTEKIEWWTLPFTNNTYRMNNIGEVERISDGFRPKIYKHQGIEVIKFTIDGKRVTKSYNRLIQTKGYTIEYKARTTRGLLSEENTKKAVKLWKQGYPATQISEKLGLHCPSTVSKTLKAEGFKITRGFQNTKTKSGTEANYTKKTCVICGKEFKPNTSNHLTCSSKCRKTYRAKKNKEYHKSIHKQRIRKYREDKDILRYRHYICRKKRNNRKRNERQEGMPSLNFIIKRDNNTCYLCGKQCDTDDCKIINGTFICGPSYPSRDHVIPRSKGGKNTADNIRLACMECNIKKSDSFLKEYKKDFIAS